MSIEVCSLEASLLREGLSEDCNEQQQWEMDGAWSHAHNIVRPKLSFAMSEETRKASEVTGDKIMTKRLIANVSQNSNGLFWTCRPIAAQ